MIRFLFTVITIIGFLAFSTPVMFYLLNLRKKDLYKSSEKAQKIVAGAFKLIIKISGAKVSVRGVENIGEDTYLFVSNHRGSFDILLGYVYTPKILGFVAKKEMKRFPLLRTWMVLVNCVFLDRDNIKEGMKTIVECIDKLKSGISMWICPEGTRGKAFSSLELSEFKEGSLKPALKSKKAIIPVAISGTAELFEKNNKRIIPHDLIIEYGKPVYIDELPEEYKRQPAAYIREVILEMLKEHVKA